MAIDVTAIRALAEAAAEWARPWGEARIDVGLGEGEPKADLRDYFSSKSHVRVPEGRVVIQARLEHATGTGALGVDLEPRGRLVSERVQERLWVPEERSLGLSAIQAWTVKEACFKASRPLELLTVTQVRLESWDAVSGGGSWGNGRFWCQARGEWVLALAVYI